MLGSWYKKYRKKRSANQLIKNVQNILSQKSQFLEPQLVRIGKERISNLVKAISTDNFQKIDETYVELKDYSDHHLKKYQKSKLRQNVESIAIAVLLALTIRAFIIQPFKIPSGSMIPTLLVGDHLLVNKFVYGVKIPFTDKRIFRFDNVKRGDVIVFRFPGDDGISGKGVHYIKRVIGIPGDVVDIRGRDIYINGNKVDMEYIGDYHYYDNGLFLTADMYRQHFLSHDFNVIYRDGSVSTTKGKLSFPLIVPPHSFFVMGDNRDNSYDSRFWGFVPEINIEGRAFLVHWSWNSHPHSFWDIVRWRRIFSSIE